MSIIIVSTVPLALFIFILKPFENKFWNKKNAIAELFFSASLACFFPLIMSDSYEEETRESISWTIFAFFYIIGLAEIVNILVAAGGKISGFLNERKTKKNATEIAKKEENNTPVVIIN